MGKLMRKIWTNDELRLLRRLYQDTPTRDLTDRLCRSERSIYAQSHILGLHKSKKYLNSADCGRLHPGHKRGKATQFKPGHRPHNFGIKGWQAGGNSVKTQFKAGHRPHTWMPVGSERIDKSGILQRKISDTGYTPRDWKSVHSIVWESHFGPVPARHIVVFRNGDKRDFHIDSLELISRAENMRRNSIHRLPKALADVCRVRGVLNRRINERMKQDEK